MNIIEDIGGAARPLMLGPALTYMLRVEVRSLRYTQRRSPPSLPCTRPGESRWVSTPQDSNGLAQWAGRPGERPSLAAHRHSQTGS